MKGLAKFSAGVLTALACSSGLPAAADNEPKVTIESLAGPLYLIEDEHYTKTNYVVYVGPSFVTLIGAGWTPDTAKMLANQIAQTIGKPVREVIDTSPDPEWSGGNAYWTRVGARVVASNVTCASLSNGWATTVETARRNFPSYPDLPLSVPAICHPGDFILQDGGIRVIYLGPSHTPADVFVYFPNEHVLDAGSILKEQIGNLANANVRQYPETLRKLQALHLEIKTIVSGHWSPIHGPDLIDTYLGFLKQNELNNPVTTP